MKKMIVIVDDDLDMATSCARVLKSQGYDTMALANPLELLKILEMIHGLDTCVRVIGLGSDVSGVVGTLYLTGL